MTVAVGAPFRTVRELWPIAWPVILSGLVALFINGNDAFLLVGSSDKVLASAVAASAVQFVAAMVVTGLVGSSQVLISRAIGSGRRDRAARRADAGLWLGMWGGTGAGVLLVFAGPVLLWLLSGPAIDGDFARAYLTVTVAALPFVGLGSALRARLAGLAQARGLLFASIAAAAVDVAVAVVLNHMIGPFGVAIGTVAGSIANALVLAWFAVRRLPAPTGVRAPRATAVFGVSRGDLRDLLALGWPEAILYGASSGAAVVVAWLLSDGPAADLAASRILELTTSSIAWIVLTGIGTAATTLLGRSLGGGDLPAFRRILRHTLIVTLSVAAGIVVLGLLLYIPILGLFAPSSVREASVPVVWLAFAQVPLMALHVPVTAAVRAMKDTRTPMIASLIAEYAVFLPLGWVLTRVIVLGLTGVFIAHVVFWVVSVLIVGIRLIGRIRTPHTLV
ncbi:MATE family efflux transporter [Microbacterium sp.]|uniref:MATE family efflux transporter n=1 Tax=Microbacterium sp. TaxID=51671 RepID=UPI003A8A9205